jgi:hypothetical protein
MEEREGKERKRKEKEKKERDMCGHLRYPMYVYVLNYYFRSNLYWSKQHGLGEYVVPHCWLSSIMCN